MHAHLDGLIPDFEPLFSLELPDDEASLDAFIVQKLSPVLPTLRTLSRNPRILTRAVLDYQSLERNAEATSDPGALARESLALATKHSDLLVALQVVNSLRSSHGPVLSKTLIHLLPNELLSVIFAEATIPVQTAASTGLQKPNMRIRAVCRRWRDTADSDPWFWACLDLRKPYIGRDQLRVVLERSRNTPLAIVVYAVSLDEEIVALLLPEMARIRVLVADGAPRDSTDSLNLDTEDAYESCQETADVEHTRGMSCMQQLLQEPAPLLENFMAVGMYAHEMSTDRNVFSEDIFAGVIPLHLRSVSIHECNPIASESAIFKSTNLTALDIKGVPVGESVDDMLVLLQALPNLRSFKWDTRHVLPGFDSPSDFERKSVHLPQLELLELVLSFETIARLIPILDISASTKLAIQGEFEFDPDARFPTSAALFEALNAAFAPHFGALLIQNIGYSHTHTHMIIQRLHYEDIPTSLGFDILMKHPTNAVPSFKYGVWGQGRVPQDEQITLMLHMLRWPGLGRCVTHLHVDHDKFMCEELEWDGLLRVLPALTSVHVAEAPALAFFRVLRANAEGAPEVASALKDVTVSGASPKTASSLFPALNATSQPMTALMQALDARVEAGLKPLALELYNCRIEQRLLAVHRGVSRLVWDGKEYNCASRTAGDEESNVNRSVAMASEEEECKTQ